MALNNSDDQGAKVERPNRTIKYTCLPGENPAETQHRLWGEWSEILMEAIRDKHSLHIPSNILVNGDLPEVMHLLETQGVRSFRFVYADRIMNQICVSDFLYQAGVGYVEFGEPKPYVRGPNEDPICKLPAFVFGETQSNYRNDDIVGGGPVIVMPSDTEAYTQPDLSAGTSSAVKKSIVAAMSAQPYTTPRRDLN